MHDVALPYEITLNLCLLFNELSNTNYSEITELL